MGRENLSNRANGGGFNSFAQEENARRAYLNRAAGALIPDFNEAVQTLAPASIKLSNTSQVDKVIALFPGALETVSEIAAIAGVTVHAIAKEGVVITDAVNCVTGDGTSMEYLQRFVNRNPTRLTRIQFKSNLEDQMDEAITFKTINPFVQKGQIVLQPSAYGKETNQNSKMITKNVTDLQLDDQTVVFIKVLAGSTLTINMSIGVVNNTGELLKAQAKSYYASK